MIRSPRLWAGVAVGLAAAWLLTRHEDEPRAFVGGWWNTPKPIRRQGRLLRRQGSEYRPSFWPFSIGRTG